MNITLLITLDIGEMVYLTQA